MGTRILMPLTWRTRCIRNAPALMQGLYSIRFSQLAHQTSVFPVICRIFHKQTFPFTVTSIQIFEVKRAGMAMQFPFFSALASLSDIFYSKHHTISGTNTNSTTNPPIDTLSPLPSRNLSLRKLYGDYIKRLHQQYIHLYTYGHFPERTNL